MNKEKVIKYALWSVIFVSGVLLGFFVRPGWDKMAVILEPKEVVYVAPVNDTRTALIKARDEEVAKYKKSPDYVALIDKIAVDHIDSMFMIDIASDAGTTQTQKQVLFEKQASQIEQHKLREINGISDATATQTIAIETKGGRR